MKSQYETLHHQQLCDSIPPLTTWLPGRGHLDIKEFHTQQREYLFSSHFFIMDERCIFSAWCEDRPMKVAGYHSVSRTVSISSGVSCRSEMGLAGNGLCTWGKMGLVPDFLVSMTWKHMEPMLKWLYKGGRGVCMCVFCKTHLKLLLIVVWKRICCTLAPLHGLIHLKMEP